MMVKVRARAHLYTTFDVSKLFIFQFEHFQILHPLPLQPTVREGDEQLLPTGLLLGRFGRDGRRNIFAYLCTDIAF